MPFGFGKKSSSNKLSKEELQASLKKKPPPAWNEHQVAAWVQLIGLPEYAQTFVDQAVTGTELVELTDSDMESLGIDKVGPRKKLKTNIATITGVPNSSSHTSSPSSNSSSSYQQQQQQQPRDVSSGQGQFTSNTQTNPSLDSSSSDGLSDEIRIKLIFEGEISKVHLPRTVSLAEVQERAAQEFEPNLIVKYKDEEDDLITIRKDSDLSNLINRARTTVKLYLYPAENNNTAAAPLPQQQQQPMQQQQQQPPLQYQSQPQQPSYPASNSSPGYQPSPASNTAPSPSNPPSRNPYPNNNNNTPTSNNNQYYPANNNNNNNAYNNNNNNRNVPSNNSYSSSRGNNSNSRW